MKRVAVAVAVLLLLLLLGVAVVPGVIGGRLLEPRITAAVRKATGGELQIDGGLHIALVPHLSFTAEGVRVVGVPSETKPDLLTLASASGQVRLLSLLSRRVVVEQLVIREPVIHLEVSADGRTNWQPDKPGGEAPASPPEAAPEAASGLAVKDLTLSDVRLENGTATYHDARTGQTLDASEINVALALPDLSRPLSLSGGLVLKGEPVTLRFSADSPGALLAGEPAALRAEVNSALMQLRYEGAVQPRPVLGLDGDLGLEVPTVGRLLAWLGWPLAAGQPDPGSLKLEAVLTAAGLRLGLQRAAIEGKAFKLQGTGSLDVSHEVTRFDADVDLPAADLDAYLPAQESESQAASAKDVVAGWSEEPFDLGSLRRAEGKARVRIGEVRYRGLSMRDGVASLALASGVLKLALDELEAAEGTVTATAILDAAQAATAALTYQTTITGVQARPLLKAFAGTDRLSGITAFEARGAARGRNQAELVRTLDGSGRFEFRDGAIHGINIAAVLRQVQSLGLDVAAGESQKTDFAELGGSFVITDGVLENHDLSLQAPLLRLSGDGQLAIPPQTLDYQLVAKLVRTLEGQGGAEDALVGLPIPIRITGTFDRPAYAVDWQSVLLEAAKDPQRLLNMPQDLRRLGKSFGVDLSIPKSLAGEQLGKALQTLPGAAGVLDQIVGPGGKQPSAQERNRRPAEAPTGRQQDKPDALDVMRGLTKGLLGN